MPVWGYGCVTHSYWFQSTHTLRYDWGRAIFVGPLHDEMPLEPLCFTEPVCGSNRPGLTQMARAQLPMQHNINRSILANGSAAFIWKLHWHWLNACNNISLLHNTGMSDVKFGYLIATLSVEHTAASPESIIHVKLPICFALQNLQNVCLNTNTFLDQCNTNSVYVICHPRSWPYSPMMEQCLVKLQIWQLYGK